MLPRTERLTLKMLRRDKEALRRLAASEGEAIAVLMRRLIRRELQARGLLPEGSGHENVETHRE